MRFVILRGNVSYVSIEGDGPTALACLQYWTDRHHTNDGVVKCIGVTALIAGNQYIFETSKVDVIEDYANRRDADFLTHGKKWAREKVISSEDGFTLVTSHREKASRDWKTFQRGCYSVWGQPVNGQSKVNPGQELVSYIYHVNEAQSSIIVRLPEYPHIPRRLLTDVVRSTLTATYVDANIFFGATKPNIDWSPPRFLI